MEENGSEDLYYRGNDLMETQRKLLFQNINQAIVQEKGEIADILLYQEKNSQEYSQIKKEREAASAEKKDSNYLEALEQKMQAIDSIQSDLLLTLQPLFHILFDQVASKTEGGLGYNNALRDDVWFDMVFGEREISGGIDGPREHYRLTRQSKHKERRSTKESEKNNEKKKQKKEKIQIPRGHKLLTKETYPHLQKTMWTNIDNVLTTYQQKFLKDIDSIEQRKGLIDHYFLFIFIQMLIQSKIIFDSKRPQSNPFFQEVIADCLDHIQKKYKIILSISPENIKKKIFTTIDENTQPLECIYKNAIDEDLVHWENYFNTYFFEFKETSVDHIRRQIMEKRKENSQNMDKSWELLNPAYHIAKEKKEKIQTTIAILQKHEAEDNLIGKVLHQLQETLKQTEDDIKRHVVFEEDPIASKELESLVKIQQQYLKRYQVPVQYRKIFGLVINRLNNFYQIKTNLYKKAQKNNNEAFDRLIHSEQTSKDILYHINTLITKQQINSFFDEKWTKKQEEKTQRIQSFCIGTNKIIPPPKQSRGDGQTTLYF